METFDDISCEELYGYYEDLDAWMNELEIDFINGELQIIAADEQAEEIGLRYNEMVRDMVMCSEFEASHAL